MIGKLNQMSWGSNEKKGGVRLWLGSLLLRLACFVIPVNDIRVFDYYPDGYAKDYSKKNVVISDQRVDYWSDFTADEVTVYSVQDENGDIVCLFRFWKDVNEAARLLSQQYEEYQFGEYVLDEENNRITLLKEAVDEVDANLSIEKHSLNRVIDYDNWPENVRTINADNIRTLEDAVESLGITERAE